MILIIQMFDRFCMYKNILNEHLCTRKGHNSIYDPSKLRKIIDDFMNKYNIIQDPVFADNIINLVTSNYKDLNNYNVIMSDDQENCFNRIDRNMSCLTTYNLVPALYNIMWVVFARPTKMLIRMADGTMKIDYQMNGGQQGNTLTMIQLILNEKVMNGMVNMLCKQLLPSYKIDIQKNYADDQTKGGNLKCCLLNYFIKEKISEPYGGKYNNKKSFLVLHKTKNDLDPKTSKYLSDLRITITENDEYEILKVERGKNNFNDKMCKKIDKIYYKLNLILKLNNKYDKMKLITAIIKNENFIYYIQTMDKYPDYDEYGNIIQTPEFEWVYKLNDLFKFIKNNIFDFVLDDTIQELLSLSTKFGGVALRTTRHIIATASISAVHKTIKKVWNDMDSEILFFTNDYFKHKTIKMVQHYNTMINNKHKINIDDIYSGYNIINEQSLLSGNETYNDYTLNENIDKLNKLFITNKIKPLIRDNCQADYDYLNEIDVEQKQIQENINNIEHTLSMKNLTKNLEIKQYHEILNKCNGSDKARILAMKSPKANSWLQRQIGPNVNHKYSMDNETFSKLTRLHFGIDIVSPYMKQDLLNCAKCGIVMDSKGRHPLNCKMGKNPTWRHDEVNKFLCKLIREETINYQYEPVKLDARTRERPDIIVHDEFEQLDKKFARFYVDTMITDIYNVQNIQQIESGNFRVFNAGKLAEKYKMDEDINRFIDLKQKGYKFIPTIMESSGGISKGLRHVMNLFLRRKADRKQKNFGIMAHNFYIYFLIFYQKLRYASLWDHHKIL